MLEFILNDIIETFLPDFEYKVKLESISITDEYKLKETMIKEVNN
jgi:hypothetical protein